MFDDWLTNHIQTLEEIWYWDEKPLYKFQTVIL
ncbi:hypothetical protein CsSME_00043828 [Camellia sinensis var. sinensis]